MPKYKKSSFSFIKPSRSYKRKVNKIKKIFRIISLSVTGLILFAAAFYLYTVTMSIKKPFAEASGGVDYSEQSYNSSKPFNVLVLELQNKEDNYSKINNLHVYRINPKENQSLLLKVPVEESISPNGVGEDDAKKISNLYKKGNIQQNNKGIEETVRYIKKQLAVDIDSYIIYDVNTIKEFEEVGIKLDGNQIPKSIKYTDFLKVKTLFDVARENIVSDLTSVEVIKIISDTKNVGESYNYKRLSSEELKSTKQFDEFWQDNTKNQAVFNERVNVSILNSTKTPLLAAWGARTVKNSQGIILETGNAIKPENENVIYTTLTPEQSPTLSHLIKMHNVEKVLPPEEFKEDPFLAKRSDILLVMGKSAVY